MRILPGFESPIHELRNKLSTNELYDLLMTGHKINICDAI